MISEDIERRRDEKGKTSERDLIRVQARLSDRGGPDLVLSIGKGQSVGFLARKIQQEAEVRLVVIFLAPLCSDPSPDPKSSAGTHRLPGPHA